MERSNYLLIHLLVVPRASSFVRTPLCATARLLSAAAAFQTEGVKRWRCSFPTPKKKASGRPAGRGVYFL